MSMKTVVFITGTNAVGKSTLAWLIIDRFGGIYEERACTTYCKDKRYGLAGRYKDKRYGGVDRITNEKGSSCTSRLAEVVKDGLNTADVMFCEGSFMDTFGLNLTNALFLGDKALVVSLYAPPAVILNRLGVRSKGKNGKRNADNLRRVLLKQERCMKAALKYQSIGVKVLQYDTSVTSAETILNEILSTIDKL